MSSIGIGYVIYNCMVTLNGIFDYNKDCINILLLFNFLLYIL